MNNELLWFLFMLIDFSIALIMFKLFKKEGLYSLIVISIIVCNIQVTKTVNIFGLTATLGNILYGSIFFATDLLGEIYGKSEARKGVFIGFAALISMTIYMQFAIMFKPDSSDFANEHLRVIFSMMPRISVASLSAYLLSQLHDVWAFHFWKERTGGKHLWLRNNFSTMMSQLIDSVVFCSIAFIGVFDFSVWWQILLTTYLFKLIVAAIDTPFIYIGRTLALRMKEGVFGETA
ncbi:MAG: queuosine precursor transporter [Thermotogaceae bacterium]|nr:queuosine precursor transporter [Thermotogaceae bacterium]